MSNMERWQLRITGVVQGVGFRPMVSRLAKELDLAGYVRNDLAGVVIEAQAHREALELFGRRLIDELPRMASIESITYTTLPLQLQTTFNIESSSEEGASGNASIPPDTSMCDDCRLELFDPTDRRFRYPFITCTNCGPRLTIVTGLPYDRMQTTMVAFPLCAHCQAEYDNPVDRRFHAQPLACADCGPTLEFVSDAETAQGDLALAAAQEALAAGRIVAIKGVGGYHVACDARNPKAVAELRLRKARGAKPFAIMVADAGSARGLVECSERDLDLLTSPAAPIVVLPVTSRGADIAAAVAPGMRTLGVMLAYSPLHTLLFAIHPQRNAETVADVLVMTSGNVADEPICTDPAEAERRLEGIADAWLHHDRPIHVACDDSVVKSADRLLPIRRSRGYAPRPMSLPEAVPPMVAVGGELKTTACLARARTAWLSQHIGDTSNLETLDLLERTITTMSKTTRTVPEVVAVDLHPGYLSSAWGAQFASSTGATLHRVQHHHAHLASLLAEHSFDPAEPVLGFTFDGTGYGSDGTIWGGEVLLGSYSGVERVAHLKPVGLPGGDAATRRPARVAMTHLFAAGIEWKPDIPSIAAADDIELSVVRRLLETGTSCTPTSSMGRLFDAVSSVLGLCHDADYEGQAAIELEELASSWTGATDSWRLDVLQAQSGWELDPAPALAAGVASVRSGEPPARAAAAFHVAVAEAVVQVATRARDRWDIRTVGLTGGVFQNLLLTGACRAGLERAGLRVLVHERVPPNDGGLALGQVAVSAAGGAT